jgi:hypothetical protein
VPDPGALPIQIEQTLVGLPSSIEVTYDGTLAGVGTLDPASFVVDYGGPTQPANAINQVGPDTLELEFLGNIAPALSLAFDGDAQEATADGTPLGAFNLDVPFP